MFDGRFDLQLPEGAEIKLSASIGISMYPEQGLSFAALYKASDEALYEAKRGGKGGAGVYDHYRKLTYKKLGAV